MVENKNREVQNLILQTENKTMNKFAESDGDFDKKYEIYFSNPMILETKKTFSLSATLGVQKYPITPNTVHLV